MAASAQDLLTPCDIFRRQATRGPLIVEEDFRVRSLVPAARERGLQVERYVRIAVAEWNRDARQPRAQMNRVDVLASLVSTCHAYEIVPRAQVVEVREGDTQGWLAGAEKVDLDKVRPTVPQLLLLPV